MITVSTLNLIIAQYGGHHVSSDSGIGMGGMGMMFGGTSILGLVLVGAIALIGYAVQSRLKSVMTHYSQEAAPVTGAEVAKRMLRDAGINDVQVISTPGQLTDHYNPSDRTVNLSEMVYAEASISAMAVAAHECGHALQHAQGYAWIGLRSSLVPMVNVGSHLGQVVLTIGLILAAIGSSTTVAWVGLALFATTTLFALVTLPVEFDASRRALAWLDRSGLLNSRMQQGAGTALHWAAMTYVVAALSSIAMLAYYAMIILSRSGDRR